jgi:uncharacterized membrane protein YcgQ (UPF0703/DUF1980 family)
MGMLETVAHAACLPVANIVAVEVRACLKKISNRLYACAVLRARRVSHVGIRIGAGHQYWTAGERELHNAHQGRISMDTVGDIEVSRISKIFEHLVTEGFRPELASETSVKVKYQGSSLYVDIDTKDTSFYSIVCAYIWEIDSPQELQAAYKVASNTSLSFKAAKAFVTANEKNVWMVMELLYPEVDQFLTTLVRGMDIVASGRRSFRDDMRKLMAGEDESVAVPPPAPSLLLN